MGDVGSTSGTAASGPLEPAEFAAWYRNVLPRVYGYLFKVTGGDRERTETLTQEILLERYEFTGFYMCVKEPSH